MPTCVTNTPALLGAESHTTIVRYKPGVSHHARWMGVILFCQKMYLWSEEMAYTPDRVNLLARINVFFFAIFYVPLWLKSSNGTEAAINDMYFIHSMLDFESIDAVIATAALQIILKHSWYLVEQTVVYALFSDNLDEEHNTALAQKLFSVPRPDSFRRRPPNLTQIIDRHTTSANLIDPESWILLQEFGINNEWLQWLVSKWPEHQPFNDIHCFVHTVKVVNDAA